MTLIPCDRLHARLSAAVCAKRWRKANRPSHKRKHAGEARSTLPLDGFGNGPVADVVLACRGCEQGRERCR